MSLVFRITNRETDDDFNRKKLAREYENIKSLKI